MTITSSLAAASNGTKNGSNGSSADPRRTGQILLRFLLDSTILHPEEWDPLPAETREKLKAIEERETLLHELADLGLLNSYQAARVQAGTVHGLVLGNYRVLGSMGAGGVGIIFMAEHLLMRRKVAIKVLPIDGDDQFELVTRFSREVRCVAQLNHPNIVSAFDAGLCRRQLPYQPDLYYFVMECLTGMDLEKYARNKPLPVAEACALLWQTASALDEAHKHHLVHRDIKPSNIFVTQEGHAKLLDFGLVRHLLGTAFTTPDVLVGTLDYMAPEQANNPTLVDIRTDIFSLGATLGYALIGQSPFSNEGSIYDMLERRQTQPALSLRSRRNDIPEALEAILNRMMAIRPEDRFATPQAVMHALAPFLDSNPHYVPSVGNESAVTGGRPVWTSPATGKAPRVLIVDHESVNRHSLANSLLPGGIECIEAESAERALYLLRDAPAEAVLIAVDMPTTDGRALLKALRDNPPCTNLKIIMISTNLDTEELAALLSAGADDYLCLPISGMQVVARVQAVIRHKLAQDHTDRLGRQLLDLNVELERSLNARTNDLVQARASFVLALARLVEHRSTESIAHLARMQRYCTTLAQEAGANARLAGAIDPKFIQTLECCVPLHDIGNIGLPDGVLLKNGRLEPAERTIMQTHPLIGAGILSQVVEHIGAGAAFLKTAIEIARHHHENYDGTGYPDGLAGDAIPLSARLVAIADTYDALRSRRAQRPGLSHAVAVQVMLEASPGRFDPLLLAAFQTRAGQFEYIFRDQTDGLSFE